MTRAYVGVGSNVDREASLRAGIAELGARFGALQLSPVYQSAAVGFEGDDFYNLVAAFDTGLGPAELDACLHEIEQRHGRRRDAPRFAPRTLDLDLLLYGALVLEHGALQLPRADIDRYAFVLRPLADIAGDMRHPVSGVSFRDLWAAFNGARDDLRAVQFDWRPDLPGRRRQA